MTTWRSTLVAAALVCLGLIGCGDDRRDRATSQVNVLGEKLRKEIGPDGWFAQAKDTEKDPWERDLVIEYERKGNVELMTIRSHGPDGLPLTKDDIVYRHQVSQRSGVEKAVEKGAGSVGRGLVKGVIDGVRENR